MKFGVGQSAARLEDDRLLKGGGRYVDDIAPAKALHAAFLRSPYAHARIKSLNLAPARAHPGVMAVYDDAATRTLGLKDMRAWFVPPQQADGAPIRAPRTPHLARQAARYVGEAVAMVVAVSRAAAEEALELIEVDYHEEAPLTDPAAALAPGAPQLHDEAPGNLACLWEAGDAAATEAALARAEHIVRLTLRNPRVVVCAMEPRAVFAEPQPDGRLHVGVVSQSSHGMRDVLADELGVDKSRLRVTTPDVGGGFGMKLMRHAEYGLVAMAALDLKAPVRWTAARAESFLADAQGRDLTSDVVAGFTRDGELLAIKAESLSNLGAWPGQSGLGVHTMFSGELLTSIYKTPAMFNRVRCVYTTTTPTEAYRGAGRPEVVYLVERALDQAAAELGLDQAEIRRRNVIPRAAIPYVTPTRQTMDSGDFAALLDAALAQSDWAGFAAREAESRARGRLRGRGLACYMERTGGSPIESARVEILPGGRVRLQIGTQANGQGHQTAFAQVLHDRLGIPFESVDLAHGDSDFNVGRTGGTGGSRSLIMGSRAIFTASDRLLEAARERAADRLEAASADLEFEAGVFRVAGTDKTIALMDLADKEALAGAGEGKGPTSTFPNGCHIVEVEIEPDTGSVSLARYHATDDFGTLVNPMLARGQVMGGAAQGVGQALLEAVAWDADSGRPLAGSFMDYAPPRADDLSAFRIEFRPDPTPSNPLGIKGAGEAGAVGAPPAVTAAVLDALRRAGADARGLDMPFTPQKVWRALKGRV